MIYKINSGKKIYNMKLQVRSMVQVHGIFVFINIFHFNSSTNSPDLQNSTQII